MVKSNILRLLPFALLVMAVQIVHQVGALVVGMERVYPFNLPYDYDLAYGQETPIGNFAMDNDVNNNAIDNDVNNELFDIKDINPYGNEKRSSRIHVLRRGCIPRGGACDNRPNDCCYNSSCRCNLWGNNCRCQRMGLFQKWG